MSHDATMEPAAAPTRSTETRLHLQIDTDAAGVVSAVVLNLPGTGGSGTTEAAAVADARASVRAALEEYGADVPWRDTQSAEAPTGAALRWVPLDG